MKHISFIIGCLLAINSATAQTIFLNTVKIEYEKTVYMRQLYKEIYPAQTFEMIKNQLPEAALSYFDFIGDTTRSVFKPGRQSTGDPRWRPVADENIVYTDYQSGKMIAQKQVYDETFLIEDSLINIKWKFTADTRMIAGFECKKAIGTIHDSITVFAFYSEELLIKGGPESIQGLPGMILGMGVPRLHATWFATKVEVNGVNLSAARPATKGKKVSNKTMIKSVIDAFRQRGSYGNLAMAFLI